jgi:D-3-phosphoglycerate dehydrogenase / 2-oxoglutarate reductase
MRMPHAFVSTAPFGQRNRAPRDLLDSAGFTYSVNPLGHRLSEDELAGFIADCDVLIAGTEPITARVMDRAPRLRLISRVGIGLDNVDLLAARSRGIAVAYTPDGPSPAVAELTIGLALSLLRGIHTANAHCHGGAWNRLIGRRLEEITTGVIGVGRVGSRVVRLLSGFGGRVLANDLEPRPVDARVEWVDQERMFREADLITLHVPLTPQTRHLVGPAELAMLKPGALLINTARGGVVDEAALAAALRSGAIGGAAVDVFSVEPYYGELAQIDTCLITCHMGSMSEDCRFRMEYEAVEHAVRFIRGEPIAQLVPESEYALQAATTAAARLA